MAEQLTTQQWEAVTNRGGKLLVSAAAGSGKTKVLVDRLLSYLTDSVNPANLDDFLIITYTKAAASELRSKIGSKLTERIAQSPENRHLQQQMQRLYLTQISTVHSFCTDILRQYAHRLDISADFRVADENECAELQVRAMEQILEQGYSSINEDPDFQAFVDSQGLGRDDRQVPQIILSVFNRAKCHLNPEKWLADCLNATDTSSLTDAAQTIWGKYLIDDLHEYVDLQIEALSNCANAAAASGMEKPAALLCDTVDQLRNLRNCNSWDGVVSALHIHYGTLSFPKNCDDPVLVQRIKAVRNACKDGLAKKMRRFTGSSDRVLADLNISAAPTRGLISLVNKFTGEYDRLKRGRRVLDFSDLEHFTLDILQGKKRTGPTAAAIEIGSRYREIMVDEYQDSNAVQDAIFSALTHKSQACFMVGDVKQSIYQFRLADPGIFLDKYAAYSYAENAKPGQGRKVLLSKNFRSGGGVIDAVNDVFVNCMSPKIGGLVYGEDEMLHEGVPHISINEPEVELYGIQVQEDSYAQEAAFVADRISQLLDGKHMIRQGDKLLPIMPEDIVILLRSPGSVGNVFFNALESRGIHCITGNSVDLLQTEEIETLRAILQVISNPLQDIPLIAVMTSRVFGFNADDLAGLRILDKFSPIYRVLDQSDNPRIKDFISTLDILRTESRMCSLSQLLDKIFIHTKMDSLFGAMQDGDLRKENLHAFCRIATQFESNGQADLLRFLEYLTVMETRGLSITEEPSNVGAVTVMSIHKSKGLEFPVVFLCGLSKTFNLEDTKGQVLCDSELGLGLCCVDMDNRVRYPTIAKRAIAAKMQAETISEEMRVLYVAMTRARDRLIMTYASKYLERELRDICDRMDMSRQLLLTSDVSCCGEWVLQSALRREEAGAFFAVAGTPDVRALTTTPWRIMYIDKTSDIATFIATPQIVPAMPQEAVTLIRESLAYRYPYLAATEMPSKQTATQLKGRYKDQEAADGTADYKHIIRNWRKPSFVNGQAEGKTYGSALHAVMQYIRFAACSDLDAVKNEICRLADEGFITQEQKDLADSRAIADFFTTEIGKKLQQSEHVLREFKFSILDDGNHYNADVKGEYVLLQGVVDCAMIEEDGITVIDFKSDRVTEETVGASAERYRTQIQAYAHAMERIYQKPIKQVLLYFFKLKQFIAI